MSAIKLICVRHGNTFESHERPVWVGKQTDLPLTAFGREQIKRAGQELQSRGILPQAIFHGDLLRQRESATILSAALTAETVRVEQSSALDEIDYGAWEGLHTDEVREGWPEDYTNWLEGVVWPREVFREEFHQRLQMLSEWLEKLRAEFPDGGCVLATSSNGILRLLNYFDRPRWQQVTESRQGGSLKVSTGGYCELEITDSGLRVLQWNCKP